MPQPGSTTSRPYKVSVLCVTYNHERFIGDALNGFLMQKTDFPVQFLVGNDHSSDGTGAVIDEFSKAHPGLLEVVHQPKNMGAMPNLASLVSRVKGKYVAICDGDDYWTSPDKLQTQADFLDQHPEFSMCFHTVTSVVAETREISSAADPFSYYAKEIAERGYLTAENLLQLNSIASLSVMYRWRLGNSLPPWMLNYGIGDLSLHLVHADGSKIGVISKPMGMYRRHAQGSWSQMNAPKNKIRSTEQYIKLLEDINAHLGSRYSAQVTAITNICKNDLKILRKKRIGNWLKESLPFKLVNKINRRTSC